MQVLVTGANGHLGTNLVSALLAGGHTVRGSVRSLADPARTSRLKALGPVELVAATLEDKASLRAAMDGMDAVVHTAAVYEIYAPGREQAIVDASVKGIAAAFRAARDARVRKVVLTSSVVTLPLTAPGAMPVTEEMWTADLRVPYIRAKTLGERHAWELAGELGLDLVSVLPGAFGGPGFGRPTPTIELIEAITKGAMALAAPPYNYPYCDVRDVAAAHLTVLEHDARGRYIACNDEHPTLAAIAHEMHAIDPSIRAPFMTVPFSLTAIMPWLDCLNSWMNDRPRAMTPELAETLRGRIWNPSNAKLKSELGWRPSIGLRRSLADTLEALRRAVPALAA